jgi:hypothetical protein
MVYWKQERSSFKKIFFSLFKEFELLRKFALVPKALCGVWSSMRTSQLCPFLVLNTLYGDLRHVFALILACCEHNGGSKPSV